MSEGTLPLLRMELMPGLRRLPACSGPALAGGSGPPLSPIALIPGFTPVLGQLDDLGVALWTLRPPLRAAPAEVAEAHLAASDLSREILDADLSRVNRSGRLGTPAAVPAGGGPPPG